MRKLTTNYKYTTGSMNNLIGLGISNRMYILLLLIFGSTFIKAEDKSFYSFDGNSISITHLTSEEKAIMEDAPPLLSYKWIRTTNALGCNYTGVWDTIGGETAVTYDPGPLTTTTYYKRITYSNLNGVVCSAMSNCITITVVPDPTVNITGAGPVCVGGSVTLTATVSGGTGTYTVVWERKLETGGTYAPIETDLGVAVNGTATHNTSTGLVAGNYYYRVIVSNTLGCGVTSGEVLGVVNTDPAIGTNASPATICQGGVAVLNTTTSGGVGLIYEWQYGGLTGASWAPVANSTPAGATYTNATGEDLTVSGITAVGTHHYRLVLSSGGSGCGTVEGTGVIVTVNPDITVTSQSTDLTECVGDNQTLTVTIDGGVGTVNIQWQVYDSMSTNWVNIPGQNSASFTPPSTVGGVKAYRVHLTNANTVSGCGEYFGTGIFVYINEVNPGTIGNDQIICIDGDPAPLMDVSQPFRDQNSGEGSTFRVINENAASTFAQQNVGNCNTTVEIKEVESILTSERIAYQLIAKGENLNSIYWGNGLTTSSILVNKSELTNMVLKVKGESGCESDIQINKLQNTNRSR